VDFLGSGISFPLRIDQRGAVALAHADEDVRQAIMVILGTTPGERPMRPEFGCRLQDFVFDGVDAYTIGRLRDEVLGALERWEPRIEVLDVTFDLSEFDAGRLLLDIAYTLRATNDVRNLVYPFYLVPAEETA
jgi:phage baseplate assembly protein W